MISRVKHTFPVQFAISLLHCIESKYLPRFVPDEKAIIKYYQKRANGRTPDIAAPKRFSEKLQWYKLNHRDPLMQICADKVAVREYIQKIGYGDLLNEVYGVYEKVGQIDPHALPDQFVLKAAHGSGQNILVKDKRKLNWLKAKMMLWSWLHQDIAWCGREWVYSGMPRRIIAERFLQDETGELRDYKFYCFHGQPAFMQLEVGRFTDQNTRNFYDMDWQLLPFGKELPHNPNIEVDRPLMFDEMKRIAADLCRPFQYVRVDLYEVGTKVYFGELTFFPAGGAPDFVPDEYDEIVGDMWKIEQ